jgi:hypothetical protein
MSAREKHDVVQVILERSKTVLLHLVPNREGVVVPPQFKEQERLVLQVGWEMPVPIPDLEIDENGIRGTLTFNREPFYCVVPWVSLFAAVGEDRYGMVWSVDQPSNSLN